MELLFKRLKEAIKKHGFGTVMAGVGLDQYRRELLREHQAKKALEATKAAEAEELEVDLIDR
jgi:hypothetical protein